MYRRLIVFANPFHASHIREFIESKTPDTPRASQCGAARCGAAGQGGAGQAGTPMGRFAQKTPDPLAPQDIVDNCPERFS